MPQPSQHPTFAFHEPRPNIPFSELPDMTYREGLENDPPGSVYFTDWNRPILALAVVLGLTFLGIAFWPAIAEFFTPFRRGVLTGIVLTIFGGLGLLSIAVCVGAGRVERASEAVRNWRPL